MRARIISLPSALVFLASLPLTPALAAPAEPTKPVPTNAFSVWAGDGHLVQTGPDSVVIVGTFGGALFTNINSDPDDIGTIRCPITLQVNLGSDSLNGNGSCEFTADDGAEAYGSWTCSGKFREGCRGDFRVTGGSGRLKDLKATSTFILRGRMAEFVTYPTEQVSAIGFAIWPDLRVLTQVAEAK